MPSVYFDRYKSYSFSLNQLLASKAAGQHLEPSSRFDSALALLAVHGGISLNDAILVEYGTGPSKEQDHERAADELKKLCGKMRVKSDGIMHLRELLQNKSKVSYGDSRLNENKVKSLVERLYRFQTWAFKNFPRLAQEL